MNLGEPVLTAVIIDADKSATTLIRSLLVSARGFQTFSAPDSAAAWALFDQIEPDIVLIGHAAPHLDAPWLTRELRRSDLPARRAPVVMLAPAPTEADINAARDAGVYEVLRKPFTSKDLMLRVNAVVDNKRDWVESIAYVGPDRRRFNSAQYAGKRRRRTDKQALADENERIGQALKIMKAAIDAIDAEPHQALRSLHAQADELQAAALAIADYQLAATAQTLRAYLHKAVDAGRFDRKRLTSDLGGMFAMPSEPEKNILWVK